MAFAVMASTEPYDGHRLGVIVMVRLNPSFDPAFLARQADQLPISQGVRYDVVGSFLVWIQLAPLPHRKIERLNLIGV